MARAYTPNNYTTGSSSVSAVPMTLACWFYPESDAATGTMLSVTYYNGGDHLRLQAAGDVAGDPIRAASYRTAGTERVADTTAGYTVGAWQHAAAVFASTSSRSVYLNGANKGTNTDSSPVLTNFNTVSTGASRISGSVSSYYTGRIAEAALWNVALTDAEIALLALGYSPLLVRPASLQSYWPLMGRTSPEIDLVAALGQTLTSAPAVADHPRVLRPSRTILQQAAVGAPPLVSHARSWAVIIG